MNIFYYLAIFKNATIWPSDIKRYIWHVHRDCPSEMSTIFHTRHPSFLELRHTHYCNKLNRILRPGLVNKIYIICCRTSIFYTFRNTEHLLVWPKCDHGNHNMITSCGKWKATQWWLSGGPVLEALAQHLSTIRHEVYAMMTLWSLLLQGLMGMRY